MEMLSTICRKKKKARERIYKYFGLCVTFTTDKKGVIRTENVLFLQSRLMFYSLGNQSGILPGLNLPRPPVLRVRDNIV